MKKFLPLGLCCMGPLCKLVKWAYLATINRLIGYISTFPIVRTDFCEHEAHYAYANISDP